MFENKDFHNFKTHLTILKIVVQSNFLLSDPNLGTCNKSLKFAIIPAKVKAHAPSGQATPQSIFPEIVPQAAHIYPIKNKNFIPRGPTWPFRLFGHNELSILNSSSRLFFLFFPPRWCQKPPPNGVPKWTQRT